MSTPKTIKEAAVRYRELGWNVIPLFEYSKNPALGNKYFSWYETTDENGKTVKKQGWKPLQDRVATDKEFDLWFNKLEPTGLGVITGKLSNIVVVDEDSYKEHGLTFPVDSPVQVRTANEGKHYYFRYNEEIPTTGLKKDIYIEIKSEGGFVVLPPSQVYKKDGVTLGQYEFIKATKEPLPKLELKDIEIIRPINQTQKQKVVLSDIDHAEIGSQHNVLRTATNSFLWKFEPEDWEKFAYPAIRKFAQEMIPPHPEKRVERLIVDCVRFNLESRERQKERKASIQTFYGKEALDEYLRLVESWRGGISTTYPELDQFFKFIPGNLYVLAGVTHVGKSIVACNLAARIAMTGKRVLYFSLEEQLRVTEKINSITGGNYPETLDIVTVGEMLSIDDIEDYLMKNTGYDIVFIDHIHFLARKRKNMIESMDENVHRLQMISAKNNVPIVFMSHLRKLNARVKDLEPTMDDLKDSQALEGVPSVIVLIHRREMLSKPEGTFYENLSRVGTFLIDKNRLYDPADPNARHTGRLKYTLNVNSVTFNPDIIALAQDRECSRAKVNTNFDFSVNAYDEDTRTPGVLKAEQTIIDLKEEK